MLTLKQIVEKLKDRNLSYIGRELDISPQYMADIAKGKATNPSYEILEKLSNYLESHP